MKKIKRNKFLRGLSMVTAAIVVFVTTYSLILPAISIEYNTAQSMPGIDVPESQIASDPDFSGELYAEDTDYSSDLMYEGAGESFQYDDYGTGELELAGSSMDDGWDSFTETDSQYAENGDEGLVYEGSEEGIAGQDGNVYTEDMSDSADVQYVTDEAANYAVTDTVNYAAGEVPADVNSLMAELEGVRLRFDFDEAMPGDSELTFKEIDEEYYDNYFVSAGYELDKIFPDFEMADAKFYSAEIPFGRTAVKASFEFDPPISEYQASENKVLVMDWCDGEWHLYDPEKTDVFRYEDGAVYGISFETDALYKGNAGFGVITLYPESDGELEVDDNEETKQSDADDSTDDKEDEGIYENNVEEPEESADYSADNESEESTDHSADNESEENIDDAYAGETAYGTSDNTGETSGEVYYDEETEEYSGNAAERTDEIAYAEENSDVTADEGETEEETSEDIPEERMTEAGEAEADDEDNNTATEEELPEDEDESAAYEEEDSDAAADIENEDPDADTEEAETGTEDAEDDTETEEMKEDSSADTNNTGKTDRKTEKTDSEEMLSETPAGAAGSQIVTVSGADYRLHVTYEEDAGIPEGAIFTAVSVEDEDYENQALELVENEADKEGTAALVGLVDLVVSVDGRVIAPTGQVKVTVEFPEDIPEHEKIYAVHFPGTGEQPDAPEKEEESEHNDQDQFLQEESEGEELIPEDYTYVQEDNYALSVNNDLEDSYNDPEDNSNVFEGNFDDPEDYSNDPGEVGSLSELTDASDELTDVTDVYTDLVPEEPFATAEAAADEDLMTVMDDENDADPVLSEDEEPIQDFTAEVLETEENGREASFTVNSFSYIALVSYTVDFHYEINGKTYYFSIPGGGFASFEQLVEVLGIGAASGIEDNNEKEYFEGENDTDSGEELIEQEADQLEEDAGIEGIDNYDEQLEEESIGSAEEDNNQIMSPNEIRISEETKKFVAEVENLEFSSPELVWVGKVNGPITVGSLKESLGLETEYSVYLTEEQIKEINGQTIDSGDWALISMQPFDTEESLTVNMMNEDQFIIKVTDAQVSPGSFWDLDGKEYALINQATANSALLTAEPHNTEGHLKAISVDVNNLNINTAKWKFKRLDQYGNFNIFTNGDYYLHIDEDGLSISSEPQSIHVDVISGKVRLTKPGTNYAVNLWNWSVDQGFFVYSRGSNNELPEQFGLFEVPAPSNTDFLVKVSPYGGGTVSGKFTGGNTTGELKSFYTNVKTGNGAGYVNYSITAKNAKGYAFDHWELDGVKVTSVSGNKITGNAVYGEGLFIGEDGGRVLTAVFEQVKDTYTISITQEDISKGHVSYNGAGNVQISTSRSEASITQETKSQDIDIMTASFSGTGKEASYTIRAISSDTDYEFDKWVASGSGQVIQWGDTGVTEESREIKPIVSGDVTITATFKKIEKVDYPSMPYNRTDLDQWMLDQLFGKTLQDVNKTAEVYDYENRIYQIDITGKSGIRAMSSDIALAFVTDISNSMLFPEAIDEVKDGDEVLKIGWTSSSSMADQLEDYAANGKIVKDSTQSTVYVTVGDDSVTATQYVIFYQSSAVYFNYTYKDSSGQTKTGTVNIPPGWYAMDASYYSRWKIGNTNINYSGRFIDLSTVKNLHKSDSEGKEYIIYTPNESFVAGLASADTLYARNGKWGSVTGNNRLFYLVESVSDALRQVNRVAEYYPTGAIYAGVETFAADTGDASNHLDFVQIGGAVTHGADYDKNLDEIDAKITNITTVDGTNQYKAIVDLKNYLHWDKLDDPEHVKKYIIMISDGAPNAKDKTPDSMINDIPGELPEGATLITVGLSMDNVEMGKKLMYKVSSTKDGNHLYYSAKRGEDLTFVLMEIVRSIMDEATIVGEVTDTIDEAFYPVDKTTGNPVQLNSSGEAYINKSGEVLSVKPDGTEYGTIKLVDGKYKVTWSDQEIEPDGWHGTVYVKAKEDFLGGQGIETNDDASMTPHSYRTGTYGNPLPEDRQTPVPMTSPQIHVDELDFTKTDTEWTVYKDTNVDPLTQIYNLYKNINVKEVVTQENSDHRISENGERMYTLTSGDDQDSILASIQDGRDQIENKDPAVIPLSEVIRLNTKSQDGSISNTDLTIDEWKQLISGEEVTRVYTEYGHTAGEIVISLTQSPDGKVTGGDADKVFTAQAQKAEHAATENETYILNVKYVPYEKDSYATGEYRTVHPGKDTDEIGSDIEGDPNYRGNKHLINVFKNIIKITKTDSSDTPKILKEAAFNVYQADPNGSEVEGMTGKYKQVTTLNTTDGVAVWDYIIPDDDQKTMGNYYADETVFYIMETSAPVGYEKLSTPVVVTFSMSDDAERQTSTNNSVIYSWLQDSGVSISGDTNYVTTPATSAEEGITTTSFQVKNDKNVDIIVIKENTENQEIPGAKFSLTKGAALMKDIHVVKKGGSWENVEDRITVAEGIFTIPVGGVEIIGLAAGEYTLTETEAPAGYLKTIKPIKFTAGRDGTVEYKNAADNPQPKVKPADSNKQYTVQNEAGAALPNTGGSGTALYYLPGSLITCAALAGAVMKRKRKAA